MDNYTCGYTGLIRYPSITEEFHPSMYAWKDSASKNLILVPLNGGYYKDLVDICSKISYLNIYIALPSSDLIFISDLYNGIMDLKGIKNSVHWVYPEKYPEGKSSVFFENAQIVTDDITLSSEFPNDSYIPSISFINTQNDFGKVMYDIKLSVGDKSIILSTHITKNSIEKYYADQSIQEIHCPYLTTLYGGLTAKDIIETDIKYRDKLVVHSLDNYIQYSYIRDNKLVSIGDEVYYDFI